MHTQYFFEMFKNVLRFTQLVAYIKTSHDFLLLNRCCQSSCQYNLPDVWRTFCFLDLLKGQKEVTSQVLVGGIGKQEWHGLRGRQGLGLIHCLKACSSPLSLGTSVTVTLSYLTKRQMHGVLQHLLTSYGLILWNIIHHDEPHSPTRSISLHWLYLPAAQIPLLKLSDQSKRDSCQASVT